MECVKTCMELRVTKEKQLRIKENELFLRIRELKVSFGKPKTAICELYESMYSEVKTHYTDTKKLIRTMQSVARSIPVRPR